MITAPGTLLPSSVGLMRMSRRTAPLPSINFGCSTMSSCSFLFSSRSWLTFFNSLIALAASSSNFESWLRNVISPTKLVSAVIGTWAMTRQDKTRPQKKSYKSHFRLKEGKIKEKEKRRLYSRMVFASSAGSNEVDTQVTISTSAGRRRV